ncbi:hypothetical protein HUU51_03300 [Candidatus Gracilibacteria bacterium]|nr:hypothetical protein [Candidatus Gracilibacteria bacterium]
MDEIQFFYGFILKKNQHPQDCGCFLEGVNSHLRPFLFPVFMGLLREFFSLALRALRAAALRNFAFTVALDLRAAMMRSPFFQQICEALFCFPYNKYKYIFVKYKN